MFQASERIAVISEDIVIAVARTTSAVLVALAKRSRSHAWRCLMPHQNGHICGIQRLRPQKQKPLRQRQAHSSGSRSPLQRARHLL